MDLDADFIRKIADNILSLMILIFFLRYFMRELEQKNKIFTDIIQANTRVVQQNTDVTIELKELIQNDIHCIAKWGNNTHAG